MFDPTSHAIDAYIDILRSDYTAISRAAEGRYG